MGALTQHLGRAMIRRGFSLKSSRLAVNWVDMLIEQVLAVVPITLQLVLTIAIFFGKEASNPGELAGGLIAAVLGLTLFVDALRVAVMPLGEVLGRELPNRIPLPATLAVACILGILCTYAEPAIASIRPLARLVDKSVTPYLYLALNDMQEPLIFSIGLGVGVAAIIGTLRFVRGWSLKPIIVAVMIPTVGCACYMQWGNPELKPLLGLAWDCGAITTGPVTVPILLALGIGVMKTTKDKARAKAMLKQAVAMGGGQQPALDGFGIVTLASLLPVLAVECLAITLSFIYTHDEIVNRPVVVVQDKPEDISPLREVVFAIRAILPLNVALVLLVVVVLRRPVPKLSFFLPDEEGATDAALKEAPRPTPKLDPHTPDVVRTGYTPAPTPGENPSSPTSSSPKSEKDGGEGNKNGGGVCSTLTVCFSNKIWENKTAGGETTIADSHVDTDLSSHTQSDASAGHLTIEAPKDGPNAGSGSAAAEDDAPPSCVAAMFPPGTVMPLIGGVLMAQVGQILFNLGLTYGFTSIGDQVGQLLPSSFLAVADEPGSPYYSFDGGVTLTICTVFLLGFLATRAEPALNVLGKTVEKLSHGSFSRNLLVYSVCVGVGAGMATGATKILFGVPIIYFILAKYGVALLLTYQADEDFTNIAWDSAGVTTGPVTVPFVLSTGIGFCKAVKGPEGFGMLTTASVAPIITTLIADLLRRAYGRFRSRRIASSQAPALPAAASGAVAAAPPPPPSAAAVADRGEDAPPVNGGGEGAIA